MFTSFIQASQARTCSAQYLLGALETIVYNLNPIADFANINIVIVNLFILAAAHQLRIGLNLRTSLTLKNGAAKTIFHSPRRNTLHTSGFATILFWRIWALETIFHNLKSIANLGNLKVFFYINEIYLVADIW